MRPDASAGPSTSPLGVMRRIVLVTLVLTTSACAAYAAHLEDRRVFWEQRLAREIPPGTDRNTILTWAASGQIHMYENAQQRILYATVEVVRYKGLIPYSCGRGDIIVRVTLDSAGHSLENEVSTAKAMCVI